MGVGILRMFKIISLIKGTCHHLVASDSSIRWSQMHNIYNYLLLLMDPR